MHQHTRRQRSARHVGGKTCLRPLQSADQSRATELTRTQAHLHSCDQTIYVYFSNNFRKDQALDHWFKSRYRHLTGVRPQLPGRTGARARCSWTNLSIDPPSLLCVRVALSRLSDIKPSERAPFSGTIYLLPPACLACILPLLHHIRSRYAPACLKHRVVPELPF